MSPPKWLRVEGKEEGTKGGWRMDDGRTSRQNKRDTLVTLHCDYSSTVPVHYTVTTVQAFQATSYCTTAVLPSISSSKCQNTHKQTNQIRINTSILEYKFPQLSEAQPPYYLLPTTYYLLPTTHYESPLIDQVKQHETTNESESRYHARRYQHGKKK